MRFSILKGFGNKRKTTNALQVDSVAAIQEIEFEHYDFNKCYASSYPLICGGVTNILPGNKRETYNLVGSGSVSSVIDEKTNEILSVRYCGKVYEGSTLTHGRLTIIENELKAIEHLYSGESYFTLSDLGNLPSSLQAIEGDVFKQFFMLGVNTVEIRSKLESGVLTSIKVNGKMITGEDITIDVINEVRRAFGKAPKGEVANCCYIRG